MTPTNERAVRRWDQPGTLYFYGGPFSCFAPTPGLRLPYGYWRHTEPRTDLVEVKSVEHWFHACKARSREIFERVLDAPRPQTAKFLGGPTGIVQLRPDWDRGVDVAVMRYANRAKFQREPYRTLLLATGDRPLVERSPSDDKWGGLDADGGYTGLNLLGCVLMGVRAQLRHQANQHYEDIRRYSSTATSRPQATQLALGRG